MDAREGGHRHAAEALSVLSVAARARRDANPEQAAQLRALTIEWEAGGAPSLPETAEAIRRVMQPFDGTEP
jgi:hypothetical protein